LQLLFVRLAWAADLEVQIDLSLAVRPQRLLGVFGEELGERAAVDDHEERRLSRAARIFARARCRSTRWFDSLSDRRLQTSSLDQPSRSRNVTTVRWASGRPSMQASTASRTSRRPTRASGVSPQSPGAADQNPSAPKREASTAGASSAPMADIGTVRL